MTRRFNWRFVGSLANSFAADDAATCASIAGRGPLADALPDGATGQRRQRGRTRATRACAAAARSFRARARARARAFRSDGDGSAVEAASAPRDLARARAVLQSLLRREGRAGSRELSEQVLPAVRGCRSANGVVGLVWELLDATIRGDDGSDDECGAGDGGLS